MLVKDFVLRNVFTDKVICLSEKNEIKIKKSNFETEGLSLSLNVDPYFPKNKVLVNFGRTDSLMYDIQLSLIESERHYLLYFLEAEQKIFLSAKRENWELEQSRREKDESD